MSKKGGAWCLGVLYSDGHKEHHVDEDFNVIKLIRIEAIQQQERHTIINWKPSRARAEKFLSKLDDNQYKLQGE